MFGLKKKEDYFTKEQIAEILKTSPEILEEFEKRYQSMEDEHTVKGNLFDLNAKQASKLFRKDPVSEELEDSEYSETYRQELIKSIVEELKAQTSVYSYDGKEGNTYSFSDLTEGTKEIITPDVIKKLPEELQPDLTGFYMKRDIQKPAYRMLLMQYDLFQKETNPKRKRQLYGSFRRGLDILDLDPIMYKIIEKNQNSMGYWLPKVAEGITENGFFKIPKTKIIKLPVSLLQLTRQDYMTLSQTTKDIVNRFVYEIAELDDTKDYFIKTGVFSSKFDFRNAKVTRGQEVHELGEYLLFIHFQTCQMAGPLTKPVSFYGVATTTEWVVREFIEDKEQNDCIYHGLPLHTEYRVFVDFDTREVIGINPYWDVDYMQSFLAKRVNEDPTVFHDYIILEKHKEAMMKRYEENKEQVRKNIQFFLDRQTQMTGQWSMDIMQNGNDFWFIDMADAANSALSFCIPEGRLKANSENWLPELA